MFEELDAEFGKKTEKPSTVDFVFYFLAQQGVSAQDLEYTPIPYIMGLLRTKSHFVEEEKKSK